MDRKKNLVFMVTLIITICLTMALIDAVFSPQYFIKSGIKLVLFFAVPLFYTIWNKELSFRGILKLERKNIIIPLLLGIAIYAFILGAYFIIGPYFDFSKVTVDLAAHYGVKKDNFVPVALYISFANSLLEELFFRGFAFLMLKKLTSVRNAYLFSATMFSLYHVAIMSTWFSPYLFVLLIFSLFVAGLFFDWLNAKKNTIYNSWLVHMCANFATNTIGFLLFGLI